MDSLLPPGSPFASVLAQPQTLSSSADAATLTVSSPPASSASQEIIITISREGHSPVSAPGPHSCAVQEVITRWASYAGLPVDALEVCHKGCPLDRQTWDLSFMQLGFGPAEVQLDVKVNHAVAGPSTPAATPDPNTPAHDSNANSSSQAGTQLPAVPSSTTAAAATQFVATVYVTVHMEGRGSVAGNGPADFKLGDLLAQATGLPVDALQVARQGCLVDRTKWSCSFAELQWGSEVELSVRALSDMSAGAAQAVINAPAGPPTTTLSPISIPGAQSTVATLLDQGRHC